MNKRIAGIVLTVLCLAAGGMYARHHGAYFVVPQEETVRAARGTADLTQAEAPREPVNINTADAAALKTLPGIGPAKAAAILEYRRTKGYFRRIEELMKVSGIKEGTFSRLSGLITVGELPEIGVSAGWPGLALPELAAAGGRP